MAASRVLLEEVEPEQHLSPPPLLRARLNSETQHISREACSQIKETR